MSNDAKAKVVFTLENADEVLDLLRQLKGIVGGQGAPAASGAAPAPGTPTGVSAAPPAGTPPTNPASANPGANPSILPQNSPIVTAGGGGSMFGYFNPQSGGFNSLVYDPTVGRFYDPSNGSYMLGGAGFGFGGGGSTNRPAVPPKDPSALEQFGGALAAYGIGQRVGQIAGQMGSDMSTAYVNGSVFHPESLIPGLTTIGMIGAGALIGGAVTSWSGPGALIGAGVGAVVGGVAGDSIKPLIQHNISLQELNRVQRYLGSPQTTEKAWWEGSFDWKMNPADAALIPGLLNPATLPSTLPLLLANHYTAPTPVPNDMIESQLQGAISGKMLGTGTYDAITKAAPDSPVVRKLITDTLTEARYSTGAILRRGLPADNENLSTDDMAKIIMEGSYGNELQSMSALKALKKNDLAKAVGANMVSRLELEDQMAGAEGEANIASYRFQRAVRYGGSAGARSAGGAFQAAMSNEASLMEKEASLMEAKDPGKAKSLRMQAQLMRMQAADAPIDAELEAKSAEVESATNLAIGRAQRTMNSALYSGAPAASLPWEAQASALQGKASQLQALMAEKKAAGRLSPAEEASMQEQIENLNYQATVGLGVQRETAVNQEAISRTSFENASMMAREVPKLLQGSAVDSVRQIDLQREAMERQQKTLENILATSKYLTAEQRLQYQTGIENLKLDEERLKVDAMRARAQAEYRTTETANVEGSVGPTVSLIRGAGGAAATSANLELLGYTEANLKAKRGQLMTSLNQGLDPNDREAQGLRREIAGMEIQREQQQRGLAVVQMSGSERAQRSRLATQEEIYATGYGTFGEIRGNLRAQIGMSSQRLDELSANRSKLKAAGKWTDAMEGDYEEAYDQEVLRAKDLAEKYNFGWDQRLISEVYNMPSQGRLVMAAFTHREAALAGIVHKAFGGTEEQTRSIREMYPNMARHLGTGNPMSIADRVAGGGDYSHSNGSSLKASLDIRILVQDPSGKVRDTGVQVANQKTSQDFNLNVSASGRQAG